MSDGRINKDKDGNNESPQAIDLDLPEDTGECVDALTEAMQDLHVKEVQESDQEQGKKNKNKKKKRQKEGGSVCFCGSPGCGIGPFVETS